MHYRTRTYIAGEWDGDSDAIGQIYTWNESNKWGFHFVDAHGYRQCYDSSMPCTIKNNLSERMGRSKTFVLVVGNGTKTARKGSCFYYDCVNKRQSFMGNYYCAVASKTYSTELKASLKDERNNEMITPIINSCDVASWKKRHYIV